MEMKALTISRLAKEVGVNIETVRYYERRGLLPKPPRSPSGYRLFPAESRRRLRFIQRAQELGFSLKEIRELLSLSVSRTNSANVRRRAQNKIADIEAKIQSLESMRETLSRLIKACARCGTTSECPILESLESADR
jgi:Hg(II)-responsive transcriptional regulator